MSFKDKLKEFSKYVQENKKILASNNKDAKFSDNTMMGTWFVNNKTKIENLAKEDNKDAKMIMDVYKRRQGLNFEDKLKEFAKYAQENKEILANDNKDIKFSDNTMMKAWFFRNKHNIDELAKENNEYAKIIMETYKANQGLSFEEKLKEFSKYVQENKKILASNNKDAKFSDNTMMGTWFSSNKQKIQELANVKNKDAKIITEIYKSNQGLSFEEKLKELVEYSQEKREIPTKDISVKFSDNTIMGTWFLNNKQKILTLANVKNKNARTLIEIYEDSQGLNFEKKLKEFARYVQEYKEIPSKNGYVKFSDKTMMGKWFFYNKKKIQNLAKENNEFAKNIDEIYKSKQKSSFEDKIKELTRYAKENDNNKNSRDEKLRTKAVMDKWLADNEKKM